ncbi:MAG: D-alanine--D-alanine ligase [Synergistaceae bacterium]|nr:D-alanine--D-alanine ligase [Synergistaceae bacterium]
MKIVIAYGGTSPEREVSLNSGASVAQALEAAGHSIILEDVKSPRSFVEKWDSFGADGVFVALHGGWGEDGRFQTCLEAFGIPYTGSGPEACMLSMDKNVSKQVFIQNGVPVPYGIMKEKGSVVGVPESEMLKKYGQLIVKPKGGGSTVGVTQAATIEALIQGLAVAWELEDFALVEQYIPGREITVSVWEKNDGDVIALPAIDIRPKVGFYDYKNKYTSGCTEYICPAPFSPEAASRLNEIAVTAHKCLGCRAYSRVDFRVTEDDRIYALEVNTAPGMTATSLVPKAAKAYGMDFAEFLESIIRVSFKIKRSL